MCRAAATALRFGAAGALAAAAHASSTAVALLVSAVARAHHRRRLAAHAPSADDETCVAEAARAMRALAAEARVDWFEQPLGKRELEGLRALRRQTGQPLGSRRKCEHSEMLLEPRLAGMVVISE